MSIVLWTLEFEVRWINTSFNSPLTFTFDMSNIMILVFHIWGSSLIYLHIEYGITFDEALECITQLCTLPLHISKVKINGGVWDLDFFLIKASSALGSLLFWSTMALDLFSTFEVFSTLEDLVDLLTYTFFPLSVTFVSPIDTSWGPWICCRYSCNCSLSCVILHSVNKVMIAFIFFKSSTTS